MHKNTILFLTNFEKREFSGFEAIAKKVLLQQQNTCVSFVNELKTAPETDELVKKKKPNLVIFKDIATELVQSTIARIKKTLGNSVEVEFLTLGKKILPNVEMVFAVEDIGKRLVVCN
ncbi:MAG TPA: hypothetical protein VLB02_00860 [Candidatus Paceibacterota bacterium]|nr:hypothetical protein [Candidatus Paceibacterota bacterium]